MFLHNREELQALRQKAEAELHRQKIRVLICAGTGCIASGSKEIYEKMHNLAEINENVSVEFGDQEERMPWLLRNGTSDENRTSRNPLH